MSTLTEAIGDAREWARRSRQPFLPFLERAITLRLEYEQTPRCSSCGSEDIRYCSGTFATGVTHPDGGGERRHEEWWQCARCGGRESYEDFLWRHLR